MNAGKRPDMLNIELFKRMAADQAVDSGVPAPVISAAFFQRFHSRQTDPFSDKLLAALRSEFGGHAVKSRKVKLKK